MVSLYEAGHTVREVQEALPPGFKAQRLIERFVPERRTAAKRDQSGPSNHMWRGERAGYQAMHLRVAAARGKPSRCSACDCVEGKFEWASLTGDYGNTNDYVRLCVPCHRRFDAFWRARVDQGG